MPTSFLQHHATALIWQTHKMFYNKGAFLNDASIMDDRTPISNLNMKYLA